MFRHKEKMKRNLEGAVQNGLGEAVWQADPGCLVW
jgi:hypothetical protein